MEESSELTIFLKTYGTFIVAFLALIQPWIIALYKRFFRQGEIDIYETGSIEIGYSTFGPTIGINGTLRCHHNDLFVQDIKLELVKQKNSSRHIFDWGVFRNQKLTMSGDQNEFEIPYGFMLSTSSPRRFNIQFHDIQVKSEMQTVINKVNEEWVKGIIDIIYQGDPQLLPEAGGLSSYPSAIIGFYEQFKKKDTHVQAYTDLDRMCYWEEGKYSLIMTVQTAKPNKQFIKKWDFNLSEQDKESVRLNSVNMLQEVLLPKLPVQYYFAFPKYEPKD